jgi:hypothetical protein
MLTKLILVRVKDKKKLNLLPFLVEDGISYSQAIDSADTVTLECLDPDWSLINSGFFDRQRDDRLDAVDMTLDGYVYRLTQVTTSNDNLSLIFEDRNVQRLRQKKKYKVASRGAVTRAQFVRSMVKLVKTNEIRFYSRELTDKQTIAKPDRPEQAAKATNTSDKDSKDKGAPSDFTIKGAKPTSEQKQNVEIALQIADDQSPNLSVHRGIYIQGPSRRV